MSKRILIFGLVLLILAGGTALLWLKVSGKHGQTTIRIAYLPVVQGLPLYVAEEQHLFTKAGLSVELTRLESPNQIIDALVAGHVDVGAPGTASGITALAEGSNPGVVKIFALIGGDNTTVNDEMLVRIDSTDRSVADLKGKKLGILPGIQFRTIAQVILKKAANLDADKDVTIVELPVGLQMQALASHQVDALLTIEPVGTIAKANNIARDLIRAPMVHYISDPWYGADGVIRTSFLQGHPTEASALLKVFGDAMEAIRTTPDGGRSYLPKYTPLTADLALRVPLPIFKMYTAITPADLTALRQFFDIFVAPGLLDHPVDPSSMFIH